MLSARGKIILEDLKALAIGACIAGAGTVLTYLLEAIPKIDFGEWSPVVVAIASILINFIRKVLSETKY